MIREEIPLEFQSHDQAGRTVGCASGHLPAACILRDGYPIAAVL